jgi:hypothetical protein
MANNQFALEPAAVSCVASTAKTVVQAVAPTNQRVKLLGWGVAFDGVLTTGKPVAIRLLRQTTAGTMSALTPVNTNGVSETIQSTAQHTASAEPTAGNVLYSGAVHPQQGILVQFPYGAEYIMGGGTRLGIEITVAAAEATVNARPHMHCEE